VSNKNENKIVIDGNAQLENIILLVDDEVDHIVIVESGIA
jgi:hypothetical protein